MARQNFIIFNPDEWRGDYAGCAGHPLVRTPHLDRLAAGGTRFAQAHVQHTVCSPARCSFMTGWYPHVQGHRTLQHLLRPHEPNLLKYLRQTGYEVAWFGKNDLLAAESVAESVDFYDDIPTAWHAIEKAVPFGRPGYYSFLSKPSPGALDETPDGKEVAEGIRFLRRPHDKPFCLYLPLIWPHCPYACVQPYHDLYDADDVPPFAPSELPGKPAYHQHIRRMRELDRTPEWVFRKLNAVYCGMITAVDDLLGRILDTLEETGLADRTTVLVFSDHGDYAGDYGLVEKWTSGLEDCLTRVPMVIRTPGGAKGHVVEEPVEVQDQFATVMELAGIEARHTHFARSLVPQLHGDAGDPERAVFAEGGFDLHEPHCFEADLSKPTFEADPEQAYYPKFRANYEHPESIARATMIRTATHKLIRRPASGEHELYDLAADPRELHNRHDDPAAAEVRRDLETRMLDWYIHTADAVPLDRDPRHLPPRAVLWPDAYGA